MASRTDLARNNIRAGVFVTITLVVMIWVIVVLTEALDYFGQKYDQYAVTYTVSEGIKNVGVGSDVRVGGLMLGTVDAVAPELSDDGVFETIRIDFSLARHIPLYLDATIRVRAPLIGAGAWLEVIDVGTVDQGSAREGVIAGDGSGGMLSSLLGPEAETVMNNTVEFTNFLAEVPGDYERLVTPVLEDVGEIAREARHDHWPVWSSQVAEIMTWAGGFTTTLDDAIGEGKAMLTDGREVIRENRDPLRTAIENAEASTADFRSLANTLNTETVERVHTLLDSGRDGLDRAKTVVARVQRDYERWSLDVGGTLADAQLASRQLKLALAEVRRSPWKILYRPETTELEHELLYEATRSFALAAADLKAATESMDRVLTNHGPELADDESAVRGLYKNLDASFRNYERAQERLFDVLVTDLP